jgi:hypothetical protein
MADDAHILGLLAMDFRGERDDAKRRQIADEYARAVDRLIKSGNWQEMPSPEDQLPDECMPPNFYDYWTHHYGIR